MGGDKILKKKIQICVMGVCIFIFVSIIYITEPDMLPRIYYNSPTFIAEENVKLKTLNELRFENLRQLSEQKKLQDELERLEQERLEQERQQELLRIQNEQIEASRGVTINNKDEVILLARLIQSEALGESYEGKVAVGAVVLNRMRSRSQSMSDVIYAKSQFSGVNGSLFKKEPSDECIMAAIESLNKKSKTNGSLYFVNQNIAKPNWVNKLTFTIKIGNHWFYK